MKIALATDTNSKNRIRHCAFSIEKSVSLHETWKHLVQNKYYIDCYPSVLGYCYEQELSLFPPRIFFILPKSLFS